MSRFLLLNDILKVNDKSTRKLVLLILVHFREESRFMSKCLRLLTVESEIMKKITFRVHIYLIFILKSL